MKFSIVIPVFNEAQNLPLLQRELQRVMQEIGSEYEIIYVDDSSTDCSLEVLKKIAQEYGQVRLISFLNNRGQSQALHAGFKASRGEWIITLDADGQNPPGEISRLLAVEGEFDFITGIRAKRKDSFLKKLSSKAARLVRRLVLKDTTKDIGCSLRMFKREVVETIPLFNNFHRFFTWLVNICGFSVKEVEVAHQQRKFGKSKYGTFKRLLEGIFDLWGVFWLKKRLINYEVNCRS